MSLTPSQDYKKNLITNDAEAIGDMQKEIDDIAEQNRHIRAAQGVRASHVESSTDSLRSAQTDLQALLSRYEDADAVEVYSDIVKQEGAFKAALQVTGRISRISILDYL